MPWLIPAIEGLFGSGAGAAGTGAAADAAAGVGTVGEFGAGASGLAGAAGSGLLGAAKKYATPFTSSLQNTLTDFKTPGVGFLQKGYDVADTAGQFKNLVHGQGGQIIQPQIQQPQVQIGVHTESEPDEYGVYKFNDTGQQMLNPNNQLIGSSQQSQ